MTAVPAIDQVATVDVGPPLQTLGGGVHVLPLDAASQFRMSLAQRKRTFSFRWGLPGLIHRGMKRRYLGVCMASRMQQQSTGLGLPFRGGEDMPVAKKYRLHRGYSSSRRPNHAAVNLTTSQTVKSAWC